MNNYLSRYIHSALMGEETAYETLYNLTKDSLFFAALNITKNDQDAITIIRESYTNAFENLNSLDNPEIFEVWLNRITAYSAYTFVIEKNPTAFSNIVENFEWNDEDNYDQLPQETIDDKDTRNIVKGIVENLPDDQRLLIIMHYYQGMDISAITKTLELPEITVMCTLSYAREHIKKEIAKAESEGRLTRSVSFGAVPFTLMELAKSQFLFHPAPPISSVIPSLTKTEAVTEDKNDIQKALNIPSPELPPQEQAFQEPEYANPYEQAPEQAFQEPEYANPYEQAPEQAFQEPEYANPYEQAPEQAVQQPEYANSYEQAPEQAFQEPEYANSYEQAPEQAVQQPEYANLYEQAPEQSFQEPEYSNPYEQAPEQSFQEPEYANPYEQAPEQSFQEPEYANLYEQAPEQAVQQPEYVNPYEQAPEQSFQEPEYSNPYEQAPEQTVQQPTSQPTNIAPAKSQPYQRVLESNFSVDSTSKSKPKKDISQKNSLSKVSQFLKSTAGIATIIGVVFVVIAAVVLYYISDAAKKSSISTDGMIETSFDMPTASEEESSHEPTAEELRAAELKADEENYEYKEYSNGTLHIVGYNGKLEDIVIPETYQNKMVTGIDPFAFEDCSHIKSVTISKNIQSISLDNKSILFNPFFDCIYMKNIYVDDANKYFTSIDGVLYSKDKTELLFYPSNKSNKSYTVLDNVTKIEVGAFQRNGIITEISLPKSLKTIGREAFYECTSLKKIEIPSGVTIINPSVFYGCKALTDVSLPNGITEIGTNAFCYCSGLREITLPKSVKSIKYFAFAYCTMLDTCTIESNTVSFESSSLATEDSIFTKTQVTLRAAKGSTTEKYANKWDIYFSYM